MDILLKIIMITIIFAVIYYLVSIIKRRESSMEIRLELDKMYFKTDEMAYAVVAELRKKKNECEIIEIGKGYPKILIDGKSYLLTYTMASIYGFPVQIIRLKPCK